MQVSPDNKQILQIEKTLAERHGRYLKSMVNDFCSFMSRKNPPTREEIRERFQKTEIDWKFYCVKNHLELRATMLFNANIAYEWEKRMRPNQQHTIKKKTRKS